MPADTATLRDFEALYKRVLTSGGEVDYGLAAPRWQFLCFLADNKEVLLHGSGNPAISRFEPRKSDDVSEFGDRKAVYAAGDGIWPIYFAILDRERHPMSLINSAMRIADGEENGDSYYFFSISDTALAMRPFRRGWVYLLPRASFELQAPIRHEGHEVRVPQWASLESVAPIARLAVGPEDFPFLDQLRGHDDDSTFARARANPDGFPWLDER